MRFSELDGKRVAIWGAGVETRSFAAILRRVLPGARIAVVVLEGPVDAPDVTDGAQIVAPDAALEPLATCDVLVRSPGVSIHHPVLQLLASRGVRIATPTGLWLAERGGRNVIGLTATKGKSTTASLIAHLVRATGRPVQLAGNIGRPALELLECGEDELAVVELSSYQTADLTIGPQVAMAGNVYPEHLQWHGSHEQYAAEKLRLLALPGVERCVVNALSPEVMAATRAPGPVFVYGEAPGWHVTAGGGIGRAAGEELVARADLPLRGTHNALNLCGALTALEALEIPIPALPGAFDGFEQLPHRLQTVYRHGGIEWVDDSISTTPQSTAAALAAFPDQQVVLIGGGFDRGQDYTNLGAVIAARGDVSVVTLPDTGARLATAVREAGGDATEAADLAAAVAAARALAAPGAVVLLSPAAASFNSHVDYQARGDEFRDLARADA